MAEARRELFGEEQLRRLLRVSRAMDAADVAGTIVNEAVAFPPGRPRDDIVVAVLTIPD